MIEFPKLEKNQVSLLRAEIMTGIVLDEDFQRYMKSKNQVVYTVFQSLEKAQEYIKQQKDIHSDIEYHIHDISQKEIYTDRTFIKNK